MNVYDADLYPNMQFEERQTQGGFGLLRSYHTGQQGKCVFKMDVAYNGTTLPAYLDKLMNGCGLVKTGLVFTPRLQAPDAAGAVVKCLTIGLWVDGKFACIYGAMGNCKITMKSAQIAVFEFEFTGILDVESDVAIVTPTYPDENAIKVRAADGTTSYDTGAGAVNMCCEQIVLDFGNQVVPKKCISAEKGFDFFFVANRMPKITANPESKLVADQDWLSHMFDSDVGDLLIVLPSTAGGGTGIQITAGAAQIKSKKPGNRDAIAIDDLEFDLCADTGNSNQQFAIEYVD
jgi:hypothetical protein